MFNVLQNKIHLTVENEVKPKKTLTLESYPKPVNILFQTA